MDQLTFAVAFFEKVFDTEPQQEVVTLQGLIRALTRFELKPKLKANIDRDLRRIDTAWSAWQAGTGSGKWWSEIERAAKAARKGGDDPQAAASLRHQALLKEARKNAKRMLPIWSPALYRSGGHRGSDGVEQLSCLVLDYDDGLTLADASQRWESWFHIVYTTWSHTPEHHRFRIVLPLANPVAAKDWADVWQWAEKQTGQSIDPAGKGVAATFAMPSVPNQDWTYDAFVHEGTILDPVIEGLIKKAASTPAFKAYQGNTRFRDGDPEHTYLEPPKQNDPTLDDFDLWDQFQAEPAEPIKPVDPLTALSTRLDTLSARVDALSAERLIDGLERLSTLHQAGQLTAAEFLTAKHQILSDH